jgi:hypothetical protein
MWSWPFTEPWPSTSDETDRLDRALQQQLAHTTPAHLIAAVGHAPLGRGLHEIVTSLIGWAADHHDEIREHRARAAAPAARS